MRLFLVAALAAAAKAQFTLSVDTHSDGSADIQVNGETWLTTSDVMARFDNQQFQAKNGTLTLQKSSNFTGSDGYGSFSGQVFEWQAGSNADNALVTTIRFYSDSNTALFSTFWPNGAKNTSCGDSDSTVSSFPSWDFGALTRPNMGFMTISGDMCGSSPHFGQFDSSITEFEGGKSGTGPFAVFDGSTMATLVISPAFNFMASSHAFHAPYLQSGVMGKAESIPAGYSTEFIVTLGPQSGINAAFDHWGRQLRERFNKGNLRESDVTMQFLQYSTDNGAYYYYNTEPNKNYEQTLKDVWAYAASEAIPYKTVLLDSWWYFKGEHDGLTEWLPMPSIFPDGMTSVTNFTGPPIAHTRWFAGDNVYAEQNGGDWPFLIEDERALPLTQGFWDWFVATSRRWGLSVLEHDWLDYIFDNFTPMQTNVTIGRMWLRQMDAGAQKSGVLIQYCMSMVRHIMQSVELPQVTQARASGDYHSDLTDQWNVGVSSILADAIGIYPTKDNAWSTAVQPGHPYKDNRTEPFSRLQYAVMTLSRGPVAVSDAIGMSDAKLIMRSCMKDGRLLQPDRPARKMDGAIASAALGSSASSINGEVWSTFSTVAGSQHHHVIAINVATAFSLTPADLALDPTVSHVVWEANATTVSAFSTSTPLPVAASDKSTFGLYHISPVSPASGLVLIGEMDKWVPTSKARFIDVVDVTEHLTVTAIGDPGEDLHVSFAKAAGGAVVTVDCTVGEGGRVAFLMPEAVCRQL